MNKKYVREKKAPRHEYAKGLFLSESELTKFEN
jgi:hypothetical protein